MPTIRSLPAFAAMCLATAASAQQPSWRIRVSSNTPGLNPVSWGPALAFDAARRVCVLFGGTTGGTATWTWDGRAWTLYQVPAPVPRVAPGMVYDSARSVVVLYGGDFGTVYSDTWEWDGAAWTQRQVSGPGPRTRHGMAYDSDRNVTVLYGGGVNDTWEYDGVAWVQRSTNDAPGGGPMAYDTVRQVTLLVDGVSTWAWNGQQWSVLAPSPVGAIDTSLAFDSHRGICVLFAGTDFEFGQTWEWNGAAWASTASSFPIARPDNGLAYDSYRRRTVLFGGRCHCDNGDSGATKETWEYGLICYPDCDGISHPPVLNINDFLCFMNSYAAALPLSTFGEQFQYANCDRSSAAPVLSVNDFLCFMNSYAACCATR